jgi:hypothetical protein
MTIDHSKCEHPRTSKGRAWCRRQKDGGGATPKTVDMSRAGSSKVDGPKTPRDKDQECMVCGVERYEYRGTDSLTGILLYTGEKCKYMIQRASDLQIFDREDKVWYTL